MQEHWSVDYHKQLAMWHTLMARYHVRKANNPLENIQIPNKPKNLP